MSEHGFRSRKGCVLRKLARAFHDKNVRKKRRGKKNVVETARLQFFVDDLSAIIDIMRYPIRATDSADLPRRATTEKGSVA